MPRTVINFFGNMVSAADAGVLDDGQPEFISNTLAGKPGVLRKRRGYVHTDIAKTLNNAYIRSMFSVVTADGQRRIYYRWDDKIYEAVGPSIEGTDTDRTTEPARRTS